MRVGLVWGTQAQRLRRRKSRQSGQYRGSGHSSCEVLSEAIDALDQSLQQTTTEHEGAAVADKGKRYARYGHETYGHGDVHEHMHREERGDADGEQRAEPVAGEARNANAVYKDQTKQAENREASQKTFFLGDYREDEIVVRDTGGQVAELRLRALRPPLAGESAGPNRDQGLIDVPRRTGAPRVDGLR
jgi:hypothetical protein